MFDDIKKGFGLAVGATLGISVVYGVAKALLDLMIEDEKIYEIYDIPEEKEES